MKIFTIGFTQKKAEDFFPLLKQQQPHLKKVVDVRLNNTSQLAGFTKKDDLRYFLKEIVGIEYVHIPGLSPTREILEEYKKHGKDWSIYEKRFLQLMKERRIEEKLSQEFMDGACLLCSEPTADRCHRRLVAEYLQSKWGDVEIIHL